MSTTLANCQIELSKQIGDYWASTTTSVGSTTSLVDTALKAKQNDWITKDTWDFITSEPAAAGTQLYEERLITSLVNSSGTLTVLAHSGIIDDGATHVNYEIHRLFSASEKARALIAAARMSYPNIFKEIRDESLVSGNWLKDGSFEVWTSTSALTYWTKATSTIAQTSTSPYYKHGTYSCGIGTAAGQVRQSITDNDDLKRLAGKTVTFSVQGWCDTASCLRLGIAVGIDGTTSYTYSDYHDGDSAWTTDEAPLEVSVTIDDNPRIIQFIIFHTNASGISYVDDARVIAGDNSKIYIGNLVLARNRPHQVLIEPTNYSSAEPWIPIRGITYDTTNGYMYLPKIVTPDLRLRVLGIGYLDFLASGVSSTAWTAAIAIDSPQLDILIAQAALYLYQEMSMPNFSHGTREKYQEMIGIWKQELVDRIARYGMIAPAALVQWS